MSQSNHTQEPSHGTARERLSIQAGAVSLGRILVRLSGLIGAAILSRYLTKDEYGTYRQVFLVYNTLLPLVVLGLPMSINYFIPQLPTKGAQKGFVIQTYGLLALLGLLFSLGMYILAPSLAQWFDNPSLVVLLRVFSLAPLVTLPVKFYQQLLISLRMPRLSAGLSAALAAGRIISVIVPVVLGLPLSAVFVSVIVFFVLQSAVVGWVIFRPFRNVRKSWNPSWLREQLRYAIPLGINSVIGLLAYQIDKIMISSYFSTEQYAVYVNGAVEIPLIGILTGSIAAVLMPEMVRRYREGQPESILRLWQASILRVSLIILPTMVLFLLYAPQLLTLLFSEKYAESSLFFRIYLAALPIRAASYSTVLLALGLSRVVWRYSLAMLVTNAVLNFLLIHAIGMAGPAVATVISLYTLAFVQTRRISRELGMSLASTFPWRGLAMRLVAAILAGGVVLVMMLTVFSNLQWFASLLAGASAYVIAYAAIGMVLRVLTRRDLMDVFDIVLGIFRRTR